MRGFLLKHFPFGISTKTKFSCMARNMAQMSGEKLMPFLLLTISLGGQFWGMVISLKKK